MQVLIPAAGLGTRFKARGYTFPKPLIEVKGKPMIQWVIESLDMMEEKHIYIVQNDGTPWEMMLSHLTPDCEVVRLNGITQGALCTCLTAREYLNPEDELIVANSDQWIKWSRLAFENTVELEDADGAILTFESIHPKWSFAEVKDEVVTRVAEKEPISKIATCGVYWFRKAGDFFKYADKMILENKRSKGEFYVCPIFNEMIQDGKKIIPYEVDEFQGLGTPEDLDAFYHRS